MRIAPCADAGFGGGGGGGHGGRAGVLVWGFREGRGGRWFEVESDGCETGAARAESLSVVSSWLIASGGVVGWCLQRGFFLEAGLLGPFKNCLLLLYNRMKALLYSRDDCPGHGSLVDSGGCGGTIISRLHCLPGFHLLINTTHSNLSTAFAFTFASTSQQYTAYVPKLLSSSILTLYKVPIPPLRHASVSHPLPLLPPSQPSNHHQQTPPSSPSTLASISSPHNPSPSQSTLILPTNPNAHSNGTNQQPRRRRRQSLQRPHPPTDLLRRGPAPPAARLRRPAPSVHPLHVPIPAQRLGRQRARRARL